MYKTLCKINKQISKVEEIFIIVLLASITIVMTLQVVSRFIFQSPLTWSQEITLFLMDYLCFFSADVALYKDSHIKVDFFVDRMSEKLAKIVMAFVGIVMCVILFIVFRFSITSVIKQINHTIGGVLQIRKSFWILPLTITFPLMILKIIEKIFSNFCGIDIKNKKEKIA